MEYLIFEKKGDGIALLTINRPMALNALSRGVMEEMLEFLSETALGENVRALIITGQGEKAFIAGADIKEMVEIDHFQMMELCELGMKVGNALEKAPYVTIAAVNGYALGGGFEMALACDFIYAAKSAKMGLPEVSLGIIPGFGGTQRLSRAVGTRQAKELIMSGRTLSAEEAKEIGVVNRLCEDNALIGDCLAAAQSIVKHSALATTQAKRAIDAGYGLPLAEALELEKNMCALCFSSPERAQAMEAFVSKKSGSSR